MDNNYIDLINKIQVTSDYVDKLTRIKVSMSENVSINNEALEILEKCINDINKIYIEDEQNEALERQVEILEGKVK